MLIHNKDDIEFVTDFPCLLGHPVEDKYKMLTRNIATHASPILSKEIAPWNGLLGPVVHLVKYCKQVRCKQTTQMKLYNCITIVYSKV